MTELGNPHWSEAKETKRLLNMLEQLESMAGTGRLQTQDAPVKPSVADQVLAQENTRLKRANKEAQTRVEHLMLQIRDKLSNLEG